MSLRDTIDTRVALRPIVDAIEEFNFQSANYSAAFGFASGGVVNVVSRSGTNMFRGSGWEFFRDDALDARNYFATEKGSFRQNQFGGVVGGPIVSNSLFFFAGYEGGRSDKGITRVVSVPTEAQRRGDFSAGPTIFNPFDIDAATGLRRPFPGNQIPASMFDSIAMKLLGSIPRANQPGSAGNLIATENDHAASDQVTVRIDGRFSEKDSVFGRYSRARYDPVPAVLWRRGAELPDGVRQSCPEPRCGLHAHLERLERQFAQRRIYASPGDTDRPRARTLHRRRAGDYRNKPAF